MENYNQQWKQENLALNLTREHELSIFANVRTTYMDWMNENYDSQGVPLDGSVAQAHTLLYGFAVGQRVEHIKDRGGVVGVVIEIDADHDLGEVTTCRVMWDCQSLEQALGLLREDSDIVWTNKLVLAEDGVGLAHG
jgi:ABC-type proline/glycine betaine transport system substrate-binding protein